MIKKVLAAAILAAASLPALATVTVFTTQLSGAAEFPPVVTTGSGTATVTFDDIAHTLRVETSFADLVGNTTAAHIHCCVSPLANPPTAGVATQTPTFSGFPSGVTAGSYDNTFDTTLDSSFSSGFLTANGGTAAGAEAALLAGMLAGNAYLNIHTSANPGGEIRGFLQPVPEPATYGLMLSGVLTVMAVAHLRRRKGG